MFIIKHILDSEEFQQLSNISVVGLMGMATFTNDMNVIESEFTSLKNFFDDNGDVETFKKGASIFKEGDHANKIYLLIIFSLVTIIPLNSLLHHSSFIFLW